MGKARWGGLFVLGLTVAAVTMAATMAMPRGRANRPRPRTRNSEGNVDG
jgi:hypothetical protein